VTFLFSPTALFSTIRTLSLIHTCGRIAEYSNKLSSCVVVAVNVALFRPAVQYYGTYRYAVASRAVDNDLSTASCTLAGRTTEPWLSVDLGSAMDVGRVCVTNDHNPRLGKPPLTLYPVIGGNVLLACACVCFVCLCANG